MPSLLKHPGKIVTIATIQTQRRCLQFYLPFQCRTSGRTPSNQLSGIITWGRKRLILADFACEFSGGGPASRGRRGVRGRATVCYRLQILRRSEKFWQHNLRRRNGFGLRGKICARAQGGLSGGRRQILARARVVGRDLQNQRVLREIVAESNRKVIRRPHPFVC